jgi:hypothetical protein
MEGSRLLVMKMLVFALLFFGAIIWIFAFSPTLLRVFSLTLLALTIGAVLDYKKRGYRQALKYLIFIIIFIISLYSLNIFTNLEDLTITDWNKIIFGVLAPICLLIVGKIITSVQIKGHKFFNYGTYWLIYLVVGVAWWLIFPNEVIIEFLFAYFVLSLLVIHYFKRLHRKKVS